MICLTRKRCISSGFKTFLEGLQRYRLLSQDDKKKLLSQADLGDPSPEEVSLINRALDLPEHTPAPQNPSDAGELDNLTFIKRELKRLKSSSRKQKRLVHRDIGARGPSKFFMGIDPTKELEPVEIKSPLFSPENETSSLVSDVERASRYEGVQRVLEEARPVAQHTLTDDFIDVLSRAVEENLSNLERPALVNELSEYRPAYAMKRAALRNLLVNRCIRNAFEESRVDKVIDSMGSVYGQRLNAPLPPEVLEPLVAFAGNVNYAFAPLRRLRDKLEGINALVDGVVSGDPDVVSKLPEFARRSNYPFDNYYGFKSAVPNEVTGSIKMGKPVADEGIRYPNLQCVAHSLPRDPKYRAAVTHAIRLLERARGWDQLSKVRAVNRLVQVYNAMAPSAHYARTMEQSVPTCDAKGRVVRTLSRQAVFNRGLRYIPSLFRNHWNRVKRKP